MNRFHVLPMVVVLLTLSVRAALAATGIAGIVRSDDGRPVAGVRVTLDGPIHAERTTDGDGLFRFTSVPSGRYVIGIERPGYERTEPTVITTADDVSNLVLRLDPASFSSLEPIGRTSSARTDRAPIQTGGSPVTVIPAARIADQGQLLVTRALNESPGAITTVSAATGGNGASLGIAAVPQIRGALSYETASLIDGHPVSVGADGSFSPLLVNPALLENVEIAKGPSTVATEITYAIGGSVNYRTLEPTRVPVLSADAGVDGYGGVDTAVRATGSFAHQRIAYAAGIATIGAPGPLHPLEIAGSQLSLAFGQPPYTIDGRAFAGAPIGFAAANTPQYYGVLGQLRFAEPLTICCAPVTTGFNSRAELGKLRFTLSDTTALTVSYLGGQSSEDVTGERLGSLVTPLNFSTFAPPPGYAGSIAAGTSIPFDNQANGNLTETRQQSLFQAELHSSIGATTVLARAYGGYASDTLVNYASTAPLQITQQAWGGALLCPAGTSASGAACTTAAGTKVAPAPTYFNGQTVTLASQNAGTFGQTIDRVRGGSIEFDRPIGAADASISFDRSSHGAQEFADAPVQAIDEYAIAPGSSQDFSTLRARVDAPLAARVIASLADYQIWYGSRFTGDGGATWNTSTHAFNAPRFTSRWLPNDDVAVRFATGASIAPPYIALLSAPGGTPLANTPGAATAYLLNENNGQIAPEEAFGYNAGADWRVRRFTTLSADVYLTSVRDLILQQTAQAGTYTPVSGVDAGNTQPLYVTQAQNIARARYAGVETSLAHAPPLGFGYLLNLTFMRAYAYGIGPSLYATAAGPYTANLGIAPNVNFQTGGTGFNGISNGRVPYAQGYGELSYRGKRGALTLGILYYGANNAYNRPAFADVSASARVQLDARTQLQISGDNLTNAYAQPFTDSFGGVPVALANGAAGAKSGYLGVTTGFNLGPPTVRAVLRIRLNP